MALAPLTEIDTKWLIDPNVKCETIKLLVRGVPIVAQQIKNPTSIHEDTGSTPGLTQWVDDPALL